MKPKVKILKAHTDQTTGKELKPGDIHQYSNDFDLGHALAFGNAKLYDETEIERAVESPPETRRRGRRKKADVVERNS